MGKRNYNKKARQQSQDNSITSSNDKLQKVVESSTDVYKNTSNDNDSNLLVAESRKLKAKKTVIGKGKEKKVLSKKERKRLQQIVDQKKKKEKVIFLLHIDRFFVKNKDKETLSQEGLGSF